MKSLKTLDFISKAGEHCALYIMELGMFVTSNYCVFLIA